MKRFFLFFVIALLFYALFGITGNRSKSVSAQELPTPTPTYDPLAEPFLPEHPSEYELGRNLYWHNCMTCHGDVGQGLTDEFRAIWPEDHQNCWDYGCHGGRRDDEGFPIPTIVPALVDEKKLSQFPSQQGLFDFLKSTHPPQDPGCLEDEQYQAIVYYVFSMNDRSLDEPTPAPVSTPTLMLIQTQEVGSGENNSSQTSLILFVGLGILLILAVFLGIKNKLSRS
jgi:mono/diheme cytochrome c family protein